MKKTRIVAIVMCVALTGLAITGCSCSSSNKTTSNSTNASSAANTSGNSSSASERDGQANNNSNTSNQGQAPASDASGQQASQAQATGIVGSFRYQDADIPELICTYTFNQDGTGKYDVAGQVQNLTYKVNGNIISITFEGTTIPMDCEFTVDAQELRMKDITDQFIVYKRI